MCRNGVYWVIMSNETVRINLTLPKAINDRVKCYQKQTHTESLPQVYRWLVESMCLYIDKNEVSPMIKVLKELNND